MQQLERTKTEKCTRLLIEKYTFVVVDVRWYVKTNTKDVKEFHRNKFEAVVIIFFFLNM